jgi:hypothetical protein
MQVIHIVYAETDELWCMNKILIPSVRLTRCVGYKTPMIGIAIWKDRNSCLGLVWYGMGLFVET